MARRRDRFELRVGDVHVWHVDLELPEVKLRPMAELLTPDERERAARLRFDHHRRQFTVARAWLRTVLGAYLGTDPARVRLAYTGAGKPHLDGNPAPLRFNLSHAHEVAVCAVTQDSELGVDVESLRPVPDLLELAEIYFSARDRRLLAQLGGTRRRDAFFQAWTRKEAWLKATGHGLASGLGHAHAASGDRQSAGLASLGGDAAEVVGWSLRDLRLRPGYIAALAVRGPIRRCLCRAWFTGPACRCAPAAEAG